METTDNTKNEFKKLLEKELKLHFFHFESKGAKCGVKASAVIVTDDFKELSRVER